MTWPQKNPGVSGIRTRDLHALEADALPLGQRGGLLMKMNSVSRFVSHQFKRIKCVFIDFHFRVKECLYDYVVQEDFAINSAHFWNVAKKKSNI